MASFNLLAEQRYSIGVNTDPWMHHFGLANYREIAVMTKDLFETQVKKGEHLKIAKRVSLKDADPQNKLFENWEETVNTCFV